MNRLSLPFAALFCSLAAACSACDLAGTSGPRSSSLPGAGITPPSSTDSPASPSAEPLAPAQSSAAGALRPLPSTPDVELLRELASGRRAMNEVIDPRRGVDIIESENGGSDDPIPPPRKTCASEADKEARRILAEIVEHDRRNTAEGLGSTLSCSDLGCEKEPRMEYDLAVHVRFERIHGQLSLASFESVDVILCDEQKVKEQRSDNQRALEQLASRRCGAR